MRRVGPCEGRVGQLGPVVEVGTANADKRDVRPFVAICEGVEKETENDKSRRST